MPLEETKRRRGTGGALHETMVKKLSNDVSQHGCLGKFKKCQREIREGGKSSLAILNRHFILNW